MIKEFLIIFIIIIGIFITSISILLAYFYSPYFAKILNIYFLKNKKYPKPARSKY